MTAESTQLIIKISDNDFTMLSYKDKAGITHTNSKNFPVEEVAKILNAREPGNFPRLLGGRGRRTEVADIVLDKFLSEALGFKEVEETLRQR